MYCPVCGAEQREGAKFCKSCGNPLFSEQPPQSAAANAPVVPSVPTTPQALAVPLPTAPPSPGDSAAPSAAVKSGRGKTPIILAIVGAVVVIAVIAVVLAVTLGGDGGSGDVAGEYYNIEDGELLELKADETFTIGEWVEGTYEVDGNKVYLTVSYLGYEADTVGTIEGKRLTVEGDVYEKK
ncbi:MAG: zinc-ribbon domain-containing protein [Actinobacteria bacterium]|nr:zinc-ribbon domain-containing protein [Actinomycetota bacterium]